MTEMVPDSMNSGALRAHKHRLRTVRTAHVIISTRRRPDTSIETADGMRRQRMAWVWARGCVCGLTGGRLASRRPWRRSLEPRQASIGSGRPAAVGSRRCSRSAGGAEKSTGQPRLHTAGSTAAARVRHRRRCNPFGLQKSSVRSRQESPRPLGRRRLRLSRGGLMVGGGPTMESTTKRKEF